MTDWIRESNLIEDVDDPAEDARCLRAWKWFVTQELNIFSLLAIHRRIMRVSLRERKLLSQLGKFRTLDVRVGDRVCPSWFTVEDRMQDWFKEFGNAATPELIMVAHIAFEKVHPFVDGNGRTGRMVMNWQRQKAGLPLLCIKAAERWDYYRWFE